MLMPKRVKHRKVQRGRMKGKATRGNFLAYGDFGIQATTCGWITSNQIEAARIAINRYIKRGGKLWIKIFPCSWWVPSCPRARSRPSAFNRAWGRPHAPATRDDGLPVVRSNLVRGGMARRGSRRPAS